MGIKVSSLVQKDIGVASIGANFLRFNQLMTVSYMILACWPFSFLLALF